jgi:hypothetical protein
VAGHASQRGRVFSGELGPAGDCASSKRPEQGVERGEWQTALQYILYSTALVHRVRVQYQVLSRCHEEEEELTNRDQVLMHGRSYVSEGNIAAATIAGEADSVGKLWELLAIE